MLDFTEDKHDCEGFVIRCEIFDRVTSEKLFIGTEVEISFFICFAIWFTKGVLFF